MIWNAKGEMLASHLASSWDESTSGPSKAESNRAGIVLHQWRKTTGSATEPQDELPVGIYEESRSTRNYRRGPREGDTKPSNILGLVLEASL